MQKCNGFKIVCDKKKPESTSVLLPIDCDLLELFDKKVKERKEKSRSEAIRAAMTCWIYSLDDRCEECPYFEPEKPKGVLKK